MLTPLPLLLVSSSTLRMIYCGFLRQFWRFKLLLPLKLPLFPKRPKRSWRPVPQTYIAERPTWTAKTSVSNERTILLLLEIWGLPRSLLSCPSSKTRSVFAGNSTSRSETQTALFQWRGTSSKRSSAIACMTYKLLWTPNGKSLKRTSSTSWRKFSIG